MRSPTRLRALLLCLVGLFAIAGSTAYGQSPQATFQSPTNGMQNVSVNPSITITTNYPIDVSSLQFQRSFREESTLYDYGDMTLTVIPQDIRDSIPDSVWRYVTVRGTFSQPNASTLIFQPTGLPYGEIYYCYVKGLRVVDGGDTLPVPSIYISFRTVEKLPYVINSSLDLMSDIARCNDKIAVTFSKKMASHTTISGNILEISRITGSSVVIDTFYTYHTVASVVSSSWIDNADSTTIFVQPTSPFIPGESYVLSVKLSRLTGDNLDNREQVFRIKQGWMVNMAVAPSGSLTSLPQGCIPDIGTGELYLPYHSTTFTIRVPAIVDSVRFKRWICPQDPLIPLVTTPTLTLTQSCGLLLDRDITAEYEKIPRVTVSVLGPPAGGGSVYVLDEGPTPGLPGAYPVYIQGEDRLVVTASPASGYRFSGWSSSNPAYNGLTTATVIVRGISTGMTLQPLFSPTACPEHKICVTVVDEKGQALPAGIVFAFPTGCQTSPGPFTVNVFASIVGGVGSCFRIVGVVANPNFISPPPPWDWEFSNIVSFGPQAFSTTVNNCEIQVVIIVAKRTVILTEELVMKNNHDLPVPYSQFINIRRSPEGISKEPETVTAKVVTRKWKYKCGDVVTLTPEVRANSGFSVDSWECGSGFTCTNIIDATKQILQITMDMDRTVRHIFKADEFRVTQVGFKRGLSITWFTIDRFISGPPTDILLPANSNKTVEMYVRFNQNVDHNTVPGNLKAKDFSDRIDRCDAPSLKTNYPYVIGMNGTLHDSKTVKFVLKTSALSGFSTFMEMTQVDITSGIKNTTGIPLSNPRTIFFETRLPGVNYVLNSLHVGENGDGDLWGDGAEIFTENIMAVGKFNAIGTPNPYTFTITSTEDINDNTTWDDLQSLLNITKLWSKEDHIAFGAIMWDEDGGSLTIRTTPLSDNTKGKLSLVFPSTWSNKRGPGSLLFNFAKPFSSPNPLDPRDELIDHGASGFVQDLYNRMNRWGVTCPNIGSRTLWYKTPGNDAWWNVTMTLVLP